LGIVLNTFKLGKIRKEFFFIFPSGIFQKISFPFHQIFCKNMLLFFIHVSKICFGFIKIFYFIITCDRFKRSLQRLDTNILRKLTWNTM
jgi:hypothetical protein